MSQTLDLYPHHHIDCPLTLKGLCEKYEHVETPPWAIDALLDVEILTQEVFDPCVGSGVLTRAARHHFNRYFVKTNDIQDWGFKPDHIHDFLIFNKDFEPLIRNKTILMNPPFSKAVDFVEMAMRYGARKIVSFQRFAWLESIERSVFWHNTPCARIHLCAERATCYWHYLTPEQRAGMNGSPTPHAWFVWERGHKRDPIGLLYKGNKS